MEEAKLAVVKILKKYPRITQNMDLTSNSALVVELAALISSDDKG